MGVNPTPTNYKALSFDGVSSRSFGVYITGQGVFDAPKRSIEMAEIPGRNGAYAVDNGNFQNIEVKYPAAIVADTEADFAEAISAFRNFLCSKVTYCRLEDEYNPDEYRMAIFKNGFEVSHEGLLTGEFEIVFDCQPQRFLTSGETAVPITSGNSITNPTLFDAYPLLEVVGDGTITVGNSPITIHNGEIGDIVILNSKTYAYTTTKAIQIDTTFANVGDTITVALGSASNCTLRCDVPVLSLSYSVTGDGYASYLPYGAYDGLAKVTQNASTFQYGTSKTVSVIGTYSLVTFMYGTLTPTVEIEVAYDGADTFTLSTTVNVPTHVTFNVESITIGSITLTSSQPVLGNPLYIDLGLGECYKEVNGSMVSVNNGVDLPAELPALKSGATTITYDNTITQFKVVPRWWIV